VTAAQALQSLEDARTAKDKENLARFGIAAPNALGVSMKNIQAVAKRAGKDHALAEALWVSGVYEARLLAAYVDEPGKVTAAQMDRWVRGFDNWGVCDTLCFALFDRTPHAWAKVHKWSGARDEFVKRAAFALLWGLTVHDKQSGDEPFLQGLVLIEQAATDERHWVKKAVSMALRATGKRNAALRAEAVIVAKRLTASASVTARSIGKEALRELRLPAN
jgi:3-methyladenine DNA glycosylase AlkD